MARASGVPGKVVAAVLAGVLTYGGGAGAAGVAFAQKPAAPAAKPTAGARPTAGVKPTASSVAVDPKKAYADGEKKFKAGDYANALVDFQAADNVKQTPQAARYIGLCEDNLGHYAEAVAAYERFLANVPPKLAEQGEELKKRVEAIKAMPGKVHIETSPAGAAVAVDGNALPNVTPTDADLAPGSHALHLTFEGRVSQDQQIDVNYASKQDVKVELPEAPPPPPPPPPAVAVAPPPAPTPPPPPAQTSSTVPALITGGLAIVAAGVGTVFGIMALQDKSDFDANPTSSKADDGENHALIADMAFGVAITLGVTSAVLFFSNGASSSAATPAKAQNDEPAKTASAAAMMRPQILPIVTPHGGGAGATWQF